MASTLPPVEEPTIYPQTSVLIMAVLSVIFGLLSFLLRAFAAIPAMLLGLVSLRQINMADGAMRGKWLAITGMLLGLIGIILDVLALFGLIFLTSNYASHKLESQNNLRRIGEGAKRHLAHQKYLPMGTVYPPAPMIARIPWQQHPIPKRLSWMVTLLPYAAKIEKEGKDDNAPRFDTKLGEIYQQFDLLSAWNAPANEEVSSTRIRLYRSPGHPTYDRNKLPPPSHYVGIAGVGPTAALLPVSDAHAGAYGYDRIVTSRDITAGLAYTALAVETTWNNGPWAAGGNSTIRGVDPQVTDLFGLNRPFGGCFKNGFHLLMIDGSVRWVNNEIPPEIFRHHATLAPDETD